jgi:hypothetical protein
MIDIKQIYKNISAQCAHSVFVKILFAIGMVPAAIALLAAAVIFFICLGIKSVLSFISDAIFPRRNKDLWIFRLFLSCMGWILMAGVIFSSIGFIFSSLFIGAPFLFGALFLIKLLSKGKKITPREKNREDKEENIITIDVNGY